MRTSWWVCIFAVDLTCSVAYRHVNQPSLLTGPIAPSEQAERPPLAQEQVLPLTYMDDGRSDEGRVQDIDSAPATSEPAQVPSPQKEVRLEDATATVTTEGVERSDVKQDLSYLHYYAYSEVAPETKPADTVLDSLKGIPPGTPVDEIKRVSDLLGLDFTFMKTVAKIESGFDPKQRTGSYIGLFQLSRREFDMYGSGDILDARDNTVAAALKFTTENVMFEMFTNRTPTLNDIYLIHQQGVEGAVEHLSQPRRLAWRSMCATYEGKEKGEKWCKRAIWGNTLPAVKRVWRNVNRVTCSISSVREADQHAPEGRAPKLRSASRADRTLSAEAGVWSVRS